MIAKSTMNEDPGMKAAPKCPRCGSDALTIARRQGFERILMGLNWQAEVLMPAL
jgi:hypothetical protein